MALDLTSIKNRIQNISSIVKLSKSSYLISAGKTSQMRKSLTDVKNAIVFASDALCKTSKSLDIWVNNYLLRRIYNSCIKSKLKTDILIEDKKKDKIAIIAFGSDTGMCGGFNSLLFKECNSKLKEDIEVKKQFNIIGGKLESIMLSKKMDFSMIIDSKKSKKMLFSEKALLISNLVKDLISKDSLDNIYFVFHEFLSVGSYKIRFLSISDIVLSLNESKKLSQSGELLPSIEGFNSSTDCFDELFDFFLSNIVKFALYNSILCENTMRMCSTDGAVKNGENLKKDLLILYNKARQSTITNELIDIVSGSQAIIDKY